MSKKTDIASRIAAEAAALVEHYRNGGEDGRTFFSTIMDGIIELQELELGGAVRRVEEAFDAEKQERYGRSPGMDALPDIKQLQLETARKLEAISAAAGAAAVGGE